VAVRRPRDRVVASRHSALTSMKEKWRCRIFAVLRDGRWQADACDG
jgi:hypothetical protein